MKGWNATVERIRARLFRRRDAYRAVFLVPSGDLGPMSAVVMDDLEHYCHANRSGLKTALSRVTGRVDPLQLAFIDGQRDVLCRIKALIAMTPDEIDRTAQRIQARIDTEDEDS